MVQCIEGYLILIKINMNQPREEPKASSSPTNKVTAAQRAEMRAVVSHAQAQLKPLSEGSDAARELLEFLEGDYTRMLEALRKFGISLEGAPTFEAIKKGLTPEVLEKAFKLQEPTLSLIPPLTRLQMMNAIDSQPGRGQLSLRGGTFQADNDLLWNEGLAEENLGWEVYIEEGAQDVPFDKDIYWERKPDANRRNGRERITRDQVILWLQKYTKQGLEVMSGARRYLTLMLKSLAEEKPIGNEFWTVLNPHAVSKDKKAGQPLGIGILRGYVSLALDYANIPSLNGRAGIRLRGAVRVKL